MRAAISQRREVLAAPDAEPAFLLIPSRRSKLRSFPRKRESRAISAFTRVFDALWGWVPAFAGTNGNECLEILPSQLRHYRSVTQRDLLSSSFLVRPLEKAWRNVCNPTSA